MNNENSVLTLSARVRKRVAERRNKMRGVISIEFAVVFSAIIVIFFFIVEVSRIIFISSAIDVVMTEATRYSAIDGRMGVNYEQVFKEEINKDIPMWPLLANDKNLQVEVAYCYNVYYLPQYLDHPQWSKCFAENYSGNNPIAVYTITYNYKLILPSLFKSLNGALTRRVIQVQEYDRLNK